MHEKPSGERPIMSGPPIEHVTEGMEVYDAHGEKVGKVELVRMGDPGAITTQGNEREPNEIVGVLARIFAPDEAEPDLPEPARARYTRAGFVKIDGPGLIETDRYVRADLIASVEGNRVTLKVGKSALPKER